MITNRIRMRKKPKGGGEPIETWDGIFADPEVGRVLHANGLIANANKSSIDELSQITTLGNYFNENKIITQFPELKYCTGLSDLINTFNACENLKEVGNIPEGVTSMSFTFNGCSSLIEVGNIPEGVTDMSFTFYNCKSLTEVLIIPESVKIVDNMFNWCSNLIEVGNIPEGVTSMDETFSGCESLVNAPSIPEGVTSMWQTFYNCYNLIEVGTIPNSVINMYNTFYKCTSLNGIFVIKPINPPLYISFEGVNVRAIYVPDDSVDTYKSARGWSDFADKIYPISSKP